MTTLAPAPTRVDHYTRITADIVRMLESGVRPWHQPWQNPYAGGTISRPLRANGIPYRGINVVVLWLHAFERGYASPHWLTFNQIRELGGAVRKGEKGTGIVYANSVETTEIDDETGEETTERKGFLKSYTVFNSEQSTGLPERYTARIENPLPLYERLEHVEAFFANTKADIRSGGAKAYYSPSGDYVQMPPMELFGSRESFFSTLAHETCHWTRAEHRLNRSFNSKRFGDDGYCVEELVAEIGAAFVCADLGITPEVMEEHASYLNSWLTVLRQDSRAIFTAAAYAEKAAGYLHQMQPHAGS